MELIFGCSFLRSDNRYVREGSWEVESCVIAQSYLSLRNKRASVCSLRARFQIFLCFTLSSNKYQSNLCISKVRILFLHRIFRQIAKTEKIHKSSDRKITLKIQCMIQKYFCPSQKHFYDSKATIWDILLPMNFPWEYFLETPEKKILTTAAPATQVEHDVRFSLMFAWNVM